MPQLLLTIAAANHDAHIVAPFVQTGAVQLSNEQSFLYLGQGQSVLKGATINAASLRFRSPNNGGVSPFPLPGPFTKLACEDADLPAPFVNGEVAVNWFGRPRTPYVNWDLAAALTFVQGQRVDSSNLAVAVQAVVNRPGWIDGIHVFWEANGINPIATWSYNWNPTVAAELLIDYTPAAPDSAQVTAAEAIVAALTAGSFSQAFTPTRSYAQWQRPFEVAEAVGLQVDIVPFSPMDDDLSSRGSIQYAPAIDVVIRKKFAAADLEEVPGENEARVKTPLVDALVALLEAINESLTARRIGGDDVVWKSNRILATYIPAHLRDKHQFTGVIRVTTEVVKDLPEP